MSPHTRDYHYSFTNSNVVSIAFRLERNPTPKSGLQGSTLKRHCWCQLYQFLTPWKIKPGKKVYVLTLHGGRRCNFREAGLKETGRWGKTRGTVVRRGCIIELNTVLQMVVWLHWSPPESLCKSTVSWNSLGTEKEGEKNKLSVAFTSQPRVSLSKSIVPVRTPPNFQVVSPDQQAASGEARVFAVQSGHGASIGALPHRYYARGS